MSAEPSNFLQLFLSYLTIFLDTGAGLVIGIVSIRALVSFLMIQRQSVKELAISKETIRLSLATGILLGLDFEVASDVLRTILVPSIEDLLVLGVVVVIRVFLSWSLTRETGRHDLALLSRGEKPIDGRTAVSRQDGEGS